MREAHEMGFSVSISGDATSATDPEAAEQAFADDLQAVVTKHADKLTYAGGTFAFSGTVDLLAPAAAGGGTTGGGTTTPEPFVVKLPGETYLQAGERLMVYNEGKPAEQQAPNLPSEADWDALVV
jgi:hypothetical protein